ncbi:MAG TPA: sulfotransferase [Sphingomicrobium sp.]
MGSRPDFLYIGTSKAGSTWLFKALSWHPQIYVYPGKNLGFFSTRFEKGWDWYVSNFDPEPQHRSVGEVSHSYLVSERAPARIRELLPSIKMIACLRDPVQRTFSDYLDRVKNGELHGTFEEELERSPALINRSRYGTQLSRYLELFDRKQLHIVCFDELVAGPTQFAAGIFEFLGVDPLPIPEKLRGKILPAGTPRSRSVANGAKMLSKLTKRFGLNALRGRVKTSPTIRNILYRPYGEGRPTIHPTTEARLRGLFAEEVRLLDSAAGTDFAGLWGYPRAVTAANVACNDPTVGVSAEPRECPTS